LASRSQNLAQPEKEKGCSSGEGRFAEFNSVGGKSKLSWKKRVRVRVRREFNPQGGRIKLSWKRRVRVWVRRELRRQEGGCQNLIPHVRYAE
jgi:hypothetical protein